MTRPTRERLDEIRNHSQHNDLLFSNLEMQELLAEIDALEEKNRVLYLDLLSCLSEYIPTPEKGYSSEPWMLWSDIRSLGNERDQLKERVKELKAILDELEIADK